METIKGYLQEIPDMQYTATGLALTKLRIHEELISPDDHLNSRIIIWAELAEAAANMLDIQAFCYFKGYWKDRSWEDSSGNKHAIKEFTARQIWRVDDGVFTDILEEYNENGAVV